MRMIIPRRGTAAAVRTAVDVAVGAAVRVAEVDAVVVVEEEAVADAAVEEGRERGFLRSGRPPARSFVVRKSPFFFLSSCNPLRYTYDSRSCFLFLPLRHTPGQLALDQLGQGQELSRLAAPNFRKSLSLAHESFRLSRIAHTVRLL